MSRPLSLPDRKCPGKKGGYVSAVLHGTSGLRGLLGKYSHVRGRCSLSNQETVPTQRRAAGSSCRKRAPDEGQSENSILGLRQTSVCQTRRQRPVSSHCSW